MRDVANTQDAGSCEPRQQCRGPPPEFDTRFCRGTAQLVIAGSAIGPFSRCRSQDATESNQWFGRSRRRSRRPDPIAASRTSEPPRRVLRTQVGRIGRASPTKNVFLNSSSDLLPGFERHRAGLNRGNATLDLGVPRTFGVGVSWALETRAEF